MNPYLLNLVVPHGILLATDAQRLVYQRFTLVGRGNHAVELTHVFHARHHQSDQETVP